MPVGGGGFLSASGGGFLSASGGDSKCQWERGDSKYQWGGF